MARESYAVEELDIVHLNPFGDPKTLVFKVGEHTCKLLLRMWDNRASYDPHMSVLSGDVVIDELEPAWEFVTPDASAMRTMILVSDTYEKFVVVKWRVDW